MTDQLTEVGMVADRQSAWLIEFTAFPEPMYFSAGKDARFSKDHLQAVRFVRKEDAERTMALLLRLYVRDYFDDELIYNRIMLNSDCYTVTEHMWCSP